MPSVKLKDLIHSELINHNLKLAEKRKGSASEKVSNKILKTDGDVGKELLDKDNHLHSSYFDPIDQSEKLLDEFCKYFKVNIFKELEKVETHTKLALQMKDYNNAALKNEKEAVELDKYDLMNRNTQLESERTDLMGELKQQEEKGV